MKKLIAKIFLVCVIVTTGLVILLGLQSINEAVPSYRFLNGRSPVAYQEFNDKSHAEDRYYIYSFEADFNDVCSKADAELIGEGFIDRTLPRNKSWVRNYWLTSSFPRGPIRIGILNNAAYIVHPISKEGEIDPKDGWIVVEIAYLPGQWWPF